MRRVVGDEQEDGYVGEAVGGTLNDVVELGTCQNEAGGCWRGRFEGLVDIPAGIGDELFWFGWPAGCHFGVLVESQPGDSKVVGLREDVRIAGKPFDVPGLVEVKEWVVQDQAGEEVGILTIGAVDTGD